jgi:hypothetical protein
MIGIQATDLMQLNDSDFQLIVEALENYKSKDFPLEMMDVMFEGLLNGNKKNLTADELFEREEKARIKKQEKIQKEAELKLFRHDVDILKAKILLLLEAKKLQESKELAEYRRRE